MILFVHGINAHADEWKPFLEYFSEKGFACDAVELREGMNLKKTYFEDYVEKVKRLLSSEDVVVGHSMGGLIVQKVAEEMEICGGVAICPPPPRDIKFNAIPWFATLRYIPSILFNRPFKLNYQFYKKYLVDCLEEVEARKVFEHDGKESAKVNFELALNRISVDESKISCPLLFIATKEDKVCPPEIVAQIAEKYDAEYEVYDGCHYIFADWRKIAERILRFVEEIGPR